MKPIISIIVPMYNASLSICRCIDSIKNQSFVSFECVIINDGSKDDSLSSAYQAIGNDGRFKILNQENQGVSAARNAGLKEIEGEYIVFVDSDDYIERDYLLTLYLTATKVNADLVLTGYKTVSNSQLTDHPHKFGNVLCKLQNPSILPPPP